jgi:hypothetical protein
LGTLLLAILASGGRQAVRRITNTSASEAMIAPGLTLMAEGRVHVDITRHLAVR